MKHALRKMLLPVLSCLILAATLPGAGAAGNTGNQWSGQRAGLIGAGAVVGTLLGGPVGTVLGVAAGDWLNGRNPSSATTRTAAHTPPSSGPFNRKGEAAVYFVTGSHRLNDSDRALLDRAARVLKADPRLHLVVVGAADPRGKHNGYDNMGLSVRRAEAVRDYLARSAGIKPARVVTKGIGAVQGNKEHYSKLRVARLKLIPDGEAGTRM